MSTRVVHSTHPVRRVEEVEDGGGDVVTTSSPTNILARIIWLVAGIIIALLAFRFVFALFGANPGNGFANFIYTTSHPFVTPFFGLFNYNYVSTGVGRFEFFTLVAIVVYAVVAALLARLFTLRP